MDKEKVEKKLIQLDLQLDYNFFKINFSTNIYKRKQQCKINYTFFELIYALQF